MSTHSYPKIHVVGSGAYYAYRPITRFIEKADRYHIRENSSRPKDFAQYLAASSSLRDGVHPRNASLPPYDPSRARTNARSSEDEAFNQRMEELNKKYNERKFERFGSLDRSGVETHRGRRLRQESALFDEDRPIKRRERSSVSLMRDDETLTAERKKIFGTGEDALTRLRRKHPFTLPVESEVVPPHESSIWPENRKHFDLVSSYDLMVDYLGIREKGQN